MIRAFISMMDTPPSVFGRVGQVASSLAYANPDVSSFSFTLPAYTDGDVAVIFVGSDLSQNIQFPASTLLTNAGFTVLNVTDGGSDSMVVAGACAYKTLNNSTDGSSISITWNPGFNTRGVDAVLVIYSGCGVPILRNTSFGFTVGYPNPGAYTGYLSSSILLVGFVIDDAVLNKVNYTSSTIVPPAGSTNLIYKQSYSTLSSTSGIGVGAIEKTNPSSTEDLGTIGNASNYQDLWVAYCIEIPKL